MRIRRLALLTISSKRSWKMVGPSIISILSPCAPKHGWAADSCDARPAKDGGIAAAAGDGVELEGALDELA